MTIDRHVEHAADGALRAGTFRTGTGTVRSAGDDG